MPSLSLSALLLIVCACVSATPPNIVFVMVDDWGWNDLGMHRDPSNRKDLSTPRLDALVSDGIDLTNAYSHHWCAPSRSSFISGRLPLHVFNAQAVSELLWDKDHPDYAGEGIPRNMTTLPAHMKRAGYSTHFAGKWDAGIATPTHTPAGRGFDTSLHYFSHANNYYTYNTTDNVMINHPIECEALRPGDLQDGWTDIWHNNAPYHDAPFGTYEDYIFRDEVMRVINDHATSNTSDPFFLYWAPHVIHAPLSAPDDYLAKYAFIEDDARRHYHAMVGLLDDMVGNLTDALKRNGQWDKTLVVVQADNGGPIYGCGNDGVTDQNMVCGGASNYPMRGGKVSTWQGGIRVNSFVTGGALPMGQRGKKMDGMLHLADWMVTFCNLAGLDDCAHDPVAAAANLPQPDSLNMWPMLSGANTTSPRTEIALTGFPNDALIRSDGWKYHEGMVTFPQWVGPQYPNASSPQDGTGFPIGNPTLNCTAGCLFNLNTDPNEHNDVSSSNPEILKEMAQRMSYWREDSWSPSRGSPDGSACPVIIHQYKGFYGPWIDI